MGELGWRSGDHVYLDTNLFIYAIEEIPPYAELVRPLLLAADRDELTLVTSMLTLAETLVVPYRRGEDELVLIYRELFTSPPPGLHVAPLSAAILESAARLRAAADSLRLPDAIHLATAESEQCDLVITNDKRLRASATIPVVVLSTMTSCAP